MVVFYLVQTTRRRTNFSNFTISHPGCFVSLQSRTRNIVQLWPLTIPFYTITWKRPFAVNPSPDQSGHLLHAVQPAVWPKPRRPYSRMSFTLNLLVWSPWRQMIGKNADERVVPGEQLGAMSRWRLAIDVRWTIKGNGGIERNSYFLKASINFANGLVYAP